MAPSNTVGLQTVFNTILCVIGVTELMVVVVAVLCVMYAMMCHVSVLRNLSVTMSNACGFCFADLGCHV